MRLRRAAWGLAVVVAACAAEDATEEIDAVATAESTRPAETDAAAQLACAPQRDVSNRASPYDSVRVAIGDGELLVCYGRPSARGRTMIGGESVPYGQLWRTGANEPTIVHVDLPATIAGIDVQPGSYSLYTIPGESEWTVIVNAAIDQWGHESSYTPEIEAQEVGRGTVTAGTTGAHVEQFTITAQPDGENAASLILEWENTRVSIPVVAR